MVFRESPTWSTVSYVNDTPANICNFVSYHLGIGVTQMRLIFDNPDDPSLNMLSLFPQVRTHALRRRVLGEFPRLERSALLGAMHARTTPARSGIMQPRKIGCCTWTRMSFYMARQIIQLPAYAMTQPMCWPLGCALRNWFCLKNRAIMIFIDANE